MIISIFIYKVHKFVTWAFVLVGKMLYPILEYLGLCDTWLWLRI